MVLKDASASNNCMGQVGGVLLPSYSWVMNHVEGARGRKSVDPLTLFLATQKALLFIFILTYRKIPSSCFSFLIFATNVFASFSF